MLRRTLWMVDDVKESRVVHTCTRTPRRTSMYASAYVHMYVRERKEESYARRKRRRERQGAGGGLREEGTTRVEEGREDR